MRKAESLPMNIIIIAVIGIIVLIIMLALFAGKIKIFGSNVGGSCQEQGGDCAKLVGNESSSKEASCSEVQGKPLLVWAVGCGCKPANADVCKDKKGMGQCCLPLVR